MKKQFIVSLSAILFLTACGNTKQNQSMHQGNEKTFMGVNDTHDNPRAYPGYTNQNQVLENADTPSDYTDSRANHVEKNRHSNQVSYVKVQNREDFYHGKERLLSYNPGLSEKINREVETVSGVNGTETIVYNNEIYVGILTGESNIEKIKRDIALKLSSYKQEYKLFILVGMDKYDAVYRISQQLKAGHYYETDIKQLDMSL